MRLNCVAVAGLMTDRFAPLSATQYVLSLSSRAEKAGWGGLGGSLRCCKGTLRRYFVDFGWAYAATETLTASSFRAGGRCGV